MTDKQLLQKLHDATQNHLEQTKAVQNAIRRFNALKKESDIKQHQGSFVESLNKFIKDLEDLKSSATSVKNDLEKPQQSNAVTQDEPDGIVTKAGNSAEKQKRLPQPEDQENMYHLKARMMPQYHSKNSALQAEVVLMSRRNELRAQRHHRQINYNRDTNLSAATTLHAIHLYEKKAKAAELRAEDLQAELDELKGSSDEKQSKSAGQSLLGPNNRVNHVIRRNEVLSNENRQQQFEIQRLKKDNSELIKKAKHAEQDRNQVMSQLSTSEMARKDLYSRYQTQKTKHDRLNRSLTKQSADWIEARKNQEQIEGDIRWASVGHAAPHGSFERTHMHAVPRNVDQPRYMFPAQQYALSAKS